MPRIYRREEVGHAVEERAGRDDERVLRLRRHFEEERPLRGGRGASERAGRQDAVVERRQSPDHRWSIRRNTGAARRTAGAGGAGHESRHRADVEASGGSPRWAIRDSWNGGDPRRVASHRPRALEGDSGGSLPSNLRHWYGLDWESQSHPRRKASLQRPDVGDSPSLELKRHPGARSLVRSGAVENVLLGSESLELMLVDVVGRDPAATGDGERRGRHLEPCTKIDDRNICAGIEPGFQVRRRDAAHPELPQKEPPSYIFHQDVADGYRYHDDAKHAAQPGGGH